jgi:hypothetical protein
MAKRTWIGGLRLASVVLALGGVPAIARAQAAPGGDAVAQARRHFGRGVKLYEEDDFRAALIEFVRAYELAPNWAVLYNVGQAYYQLRDYAGALVTLEKYVREGGGQIAQDRKEQVDLELQELRGRVARVTVIPSVAGASVTLDETPLDRAAVQGLLVSAGRHTLAASKRGYVGATRVVDVAGGDQIEVRLDLAADVRDVARPRAPANYSAAVVSGAFGLAGVAVGATFGALAMGNKSSLATECTAARVCPASARDDVDAFSRNAAISTAGFAVGGLGVAAAVYFYLSERSREARESSGESMSREGAHASTVRPWMGVGGAGVTGTF